MSMIFGKFIVFYQYHYNQFLEHLYHSNFWTWTKHFFLKTAQSSPLTLDTQLELTECVRVTLYLVNADGVKGLTSVNKHRLTYFIQRILHVLKTMNLFGFCIEGPRKKKCSGISLSLGNQQPTNPQTLGRLISPYTFIVSKWSYLLG